MASKPHKHIFVLMPFKPEFDDVYMVIRDACSDRSIGIDILCTRADEIDSPGKITDQILAAIESADGLVADITGSNPNVMYEVGYATALRKPVVLLNQTVENSPFDVKDLRQILYDRNRLVKDCRPRLVSSLISILGTDEVPRDSANASSKSDGVEASVPIRRTRRISEALVAEVAALELRCQLANNRSNSNELIGYAKKLIEIIDTISLTDTPSSDDLHNFVGQLGNCAVEFQRGELLQEAEDVWKRAIGLGPNHAGVHLQYAHFLVKAGRVEDAKNEIRRGKELSPDDSRISNLETMIAIKTGRADPSLGDKLRARFETNKTKSTHATEYLLYLAQTNAPASEFERVCAEWEAALPEAEKWKARRAMADFVASNHANEESRSKAKALYEVILRDNLSDQERAATLHNLATLHFIDELSDDAIRRWTEAYRLDPLDLNIRSAFSQCLSRLKKYDEAMKVMEGNPLA